MLGFLRKHVHRHVRDIIHRPWMQWSIRIYEGYNELPPKASLLYGIETASARGETFFSTRLT
jgi:hypothetical protein